MKFLCQVKLACLILVTSCQNLQANVCHDAQYYDSQHNDTCIVMLSVAVSYNLTTRAVLDWDKLLPFSKIKDLAVKACQHY